MYNTVLCLVVVTSGIWADSDNGYDLNLEQIFRTPKDFSKANFDHFEILERNNFENQNASPSTPSADNAAPQTTDNPFKSIANAQVMLRIGGDNIRDCNRVTIHPRRSARVVEEQLDRPMYPHTNRPHCQHFLPSMPYPLPPHCIYPYPPLPPYGFPGCYYGSRRNLPYQQSPFSLYNGQLVPAETLAESPDEDFFLEKAVEKRTTIRMNQGLPKVVETVQVTADKPKGNCIDDKTYIVEETPTEILEKGSCIESPSKVITLKKIETTTVNPNPHPHRVAYVEVNLTDAKKDSHGDQIDSLLDQSLLPFTCQKCNRKRNWLVSYPVTNKLTTIPEEEIVVNGCPCCSTHGVCNCCNRERNASIPFGKRFSKDMDSLYEIVSPVTASEKPVREDVLEMTPHVQINNQLIDAKVCLPTTVVERVHPWKDIMNIRPSGYRYLETRLPLPTEITEGYRPPLAEIPSIREAAVSSWRGIVPVSSAGEEHVNIPSVESSTIIQIPYMQNDVAELFTPHSHPYFITEEGAEFLPIGNKVEPLLYSNGYLSSSPCHTIHHEPKLHIEGVHTSDVVGYYSHPSQSVDKYPNHALPVVKHKQPHIYKVVPKYDIIPRGDIKPLNIPDLVPTNHYLYTKCHEPPVERLPLIKNVIFIPGWPFSRDVPLTRDVPLAPGYTRRCTECAKYRGELNEFSDRC